MWTDSVAEINVFDILKNIHIRFNQINKVKNIDIAKKVELLKQNLKNGILLALTEPFHNTNLPPILPCFHVYRFQNCIKNVSSAIFQDFWLQTTSDLQYLA